MSGSKVSRLDVWTDRIRLIGAGLDVFDPEPPRVDNRLFPLDGVVSTPRTAGSVFDDVENVARHAFGNMQAFLRGDPLPPADLVSGVSLAASDGGAHRLAAP